MIAIFVSCSIRIMMYLTCKKINSYLNTLLKDIKRTPLCSTLKLRIVLFSNVFSFRESLAYPIRYLFNSKGLKNGNFYKKKAFPNSWCTKLVGNTNKKDSQHKKNKYFDKKRKWKPCIFTQNIPRYLDNHQISNVEKVMLS